MHRRQSRHVDARLRHLGTARTGAYFSLAPFIGAVLGLILFREPVTVQLFLAGLLMAIGLWLHLAERHVHEHAHQTLEHEHAHVHDEHHQQRHDGVVTEPRRTGIGTSRCSIRTHTIPTCTIGMATAEGVRVDAETC